MAISKISLKAEVLDANAPVANEINRYLSERGVFCVNVIGGAGAGKTSALIGIIKRLGLPNVHVIEGDIAGDIDTETLRKLGVVAYQLHTNGECHINAPTMKEILRENEPKEGSILYVENIGNLVCPAEFVIGEHRKMLVSSAPEGSDKPYKYPHSFEVVQAVVLTKADLAPYVKFDRAYYDKGVHALNPTAPIFETSAAQDTGFEAVAEWILAERKKLSLD
jgi:hydrogenase nickel incorporation protein HypB